MVVTGVKRHSRHLVGSAALLMPGVQVRLTKKFANLINGIDLSRSRVGDVITLRARDAQLLIAEGWAVPHAGIPEPRAKKPGRIRKRGD